MFWCWLGRGIPGVLVASLLIALGDAFRSGADQALLYRSVAALGREEEFQRIEARTRAVSLTTMVGQVVAGGVIVTTWGFAAGWITETMLSVAGLALAWAMVEPPARESRASHNPGRSPEHATRISVLRFVALLALVTPAAFVDSVVSATAFVAKTAPGAEPLGVTVLVAVMTLAEAMGSWLATRVPSSGVRQQLALGAATLVLLATALAVRASLGPVVVAASFFLGVAHPLRAAAIQRLATDGVRARAASIASVCDMAFRTVALAVAGRAARGK